MQASGEVARGRASYGPTAVRMLGAQRAQVTACLHDAEVVVTATTGQPVPGIEGEVADELVTSTMELVTGTWKLASQTVGVGQCTAS